MEPSHLPRLLRTYLVEDNVHIRSSLVAALEELVPVEVVGCAGDEDFAVRWLSENSADLVIIDIFLRSGSGLGVLESMNRRHSDAASVVLTNFATAAMRKRCADLGAARVFDKSEQIDELVEFCAALSADRCTAGFESRS